MVCVAANAGGTPRSRSGDSRRSCMVGRGLVDALSPASERSTASPKSSLNPLVQNGVRAWRARSLLVTPRRRSQSLSRFWCTTRRKVGTTRQTRTVWCSSMARMVRKWRDVSGLPLATQSVLRLSEHSFSFRYCVHRQNGCAKAGSAGLVLLPEDLWRRGLPRLWSARHPTELDQANEEYEG